MAYYKPDTPNPCHCACPHDLNSVPLPGRPAVSTWAVSWENMPQDLCHHTKRRNGGRGATNLSFGMTPTTEYNL